MKKIITLLTVSLSLLAVTSCGSRASTSTPTPSTPVPSTPTPSTPSGEKITISENAGTYYDSIQFDKTPAELKTDLHNLITANYTSITYAAVKTAYLTTDVREDGTIWDMYSSIKWSSKDSSVVCGNYGKEGDCYNREHSIPNSWFGGNKNTEEYSDLFHLYPTDGYVNGQRSNYPFGEVASGITYTSTNNSLLGSADTKYGYKGTVFEPIDEYKGDFARTYFYFCTRYEGNLMTDKNGSIVFTDKGVFPGLTQYSIDLFLTWDELDPISEKEIARNDIIYKDFQHNRNPFIDIQGLSTYLWGDLKSASL